MHAEPPVSCDACISLNSNFNDTSAVQRPVVARPMAFIPVVKQQGQQRGKQKLPPGVSAATSLRDSAARLYHTDRK